MKNLQQNLLITLALALCGLCVWQWYFQAEQRQLLTAQNQTIFDRDTAIQGYTNSLRTMDRQIAQLSQQVTSLTNLLHQTILTNDAFIVAQRRELARSAATNDSLTAQISQYQGAVTNLQTKLNDAYDGIKKQNSAVEKLVAQRDEYVGLYTNSVTKYNDLAAKYNELVDRLTKLQSAATNNPPK